MDPLISHRASLISYMPCSIHDDEQLTALCFNQRCQDYLKLLCIHCQDNHPSHSTNKYIKSFKKSFSEIKQQFDYEKNQIEQRSTLSFDHQLLYNQILDIAEEYALLSQQLQQISTDIRQTADKIFFQAVTDKSKAENCLDTIFKNGIEVETLQQAINDLKNFISVDHENGYQIQFKIENSDLNQQDKQYIAKQYILKMQTNFKKCRDTLDALQVQAQSPDEEQIVLQKYKFSQELKHPDYMRQLYFYIFDSIELIFFFLKSNYHILQLMKIAQYINKGHQIRIQLLYQVVKQIKIKDTYGNFGSRRKHPTICLSDFVQNHWQIGGGIYLINSSGQSYSNSEQLEHNKINVLGRFYTGDIIMMEFNPDLKKLSFVKNDNYHKKTQLTIPLPIDDDLYPCVKICDKNDEIQIID